MEPLLDAPPPIDVRVTRRTSGLYDSEIDELAQHLRSRLEQDLPPGGGPRRAWTTMLGWVAVAGFATAGTAALGPWTALYGDAAADGAEGFNLVTSRWTGARVSMLLVAAVGALATLALVLPSRGTAADRRTTTRRRVGGPVAAAAAVALLVGLVSSARSVGAGAATSETGTVAAPALWIAVAAAVVAALAITVVMASTMERPSEGSTVRGLAAPLAVALVAVGAGAGVGAVVPTEGGVRSVRLGAFEVLAGGGDRQPVWGEPAVQVDLGEGRVQNSLAPSPEPWEEQPATAVVDLDGTGRLWIANAGEGAVVLSEVVDGRILPQTRVTAGDYDVEVVAVTQGRALVKTDDSNSNRNSDATSLWLVPVDRSESTPPEYPGVPAQDLEAGVGRGDRDVVEALRVDRSRGDRLGSVQTVADGSIAITISREEGRDLLRVPHPRLLDLAAWAPDRVVAVDGQEGALTAGRPGVLVSERDGEYPYSSLALVDERNGLDRPAQLILGGALDPDCTISDEPLQIAMHTTAVAVDGQANRWVAAITGETTTILVQRANGEVRVVSKEAAYVPAMTVTTDGDLLVTEGSGEGDSPRRMLRLADAAAAADRFPMAPPPPDSCTRTSQTVVKTIGATFTPLLSGPFADRELLAPDGTYVDTEPLDESTDLGKRNRVVLHRPDGATSVLATRNFEGEVVADGLGGVWWVDATKPSSGRYSVVVVHQPAAGPAEEFEVNTAAGTEPSVNVPIRLRADPASGTLYYALSSPSDTTTWSRVPIGGRPRAVLAGAADELVVSGEMVARGDRVYLTDGATLSSVTTRARTDRWLGSTKRDRVLPLGVALAEDAPADRYPVGATIVGPDGFPWMLVDGYLVRVTAPGSVEPLGGPDDGLSPDRRNSSRLVGFGDDVYVVGDDGLIRVSVP